MVPQEIGRGLGMDWTDLAPERKKKTFDCYEEGLVKNCIFTIIQ